MIQAVYAGFLGLVCTVGLAASDQGEFPLSSPLSSMSSSQQKRVSLFARRGQSLSILPVVDLPDQFVAALASAELSASAEGAGDVPTPTPISKLCSKFTSAFAQSEEDSDFLAKRARRPLFSPISFITLPEDFAIEGVKFYVGPREEAENIRFLRETGITHVISITAESEEPMKFAEGISILPLQFPDNGEASLEEPIKSAYEFIEMARNFSHLAAEQVPSRVFIHCHAGQSRSVSILLSYLMQKQYEKRREEGVLSGCSTLLSPLLKVVQNSRPSANPNFSFLGELQVLEMKWRNEVRH